MTFVFDLGERVETACGPGTVIMEDCGSGHVGVKLDEPYLGRIIAYEEIRDVHALQLRLERPS